MTSHTSKELLQQYSAGRDGAATEIFDRYVMRLVALVRKRTSPKLARRFDPQDVVQSAYRSFFVAARDGQFVWRRSGDLWRLLVAITLNKLHGQIERQTAGKRDVAKEKSPGDLAFEKLAPNPTPDEEAALLEQLQQFMVGLSEAKRQVLQMRLAGLTVEQIAVGINRSQRTVRRLLQQVQADLEAQLIGKDTEFPAPHPKRNIPLEPNPRASLPFSDFLLQEHLGTGGMGKVYRAWQQSLSRQVTVKALLKSRQYDAEAVERFLLEGQLLGRLRHPGIVGVHGLGRFPGGGYFLVLDYIDGEDLARHIETRLPDFRRAVKIAIAVCDAIQYAHGQGIVHCDLKPGNVLLDGNENVFVTDFGLAQLLSYRTTTHIMPAGGTLGYMAPEQLDPLSTDFKPTIDVYGIGAILYTLLTGRAPIEVDDMVMAVKLLSSDEPVKNPTAWREEVPSDLEAICLRCLEKNPKKRFSSATDIATALQIWLDCK